MKRPILHSLEAKTHEEMIRKVFRRLEEIEPFQSERRNQ
jgi:hypothetical protein